MLHPSRNPRPRRATLTARVAGVLALGLIVSLGPGVVGSREAVGARAARPTLIRLVATNVILQVVVDKPPRGNSTGDTVFTTNVLANAVAQLGSAKGDIAGSDAGRTTNAGSARATVDVLTTLRGGTLRVRGRTRQLGQTQVVPVVGGTGRFKGATGTLTAQAIPRTGESSNVYRLRY